jgi:hypothetical protein
MNGIFLKPNEQYRTGLDFRCLAVGLVSKAGGLECPTTLRQAVKSKEAISIRDLYASQLDNLDRDIWNGPFAGKVANLAHEGNVRDILSQGRSVKQTTPHRQHHPASGDHQGTSAFDTVPDVWPADHVVMDRKPYGERLIHLT